jgi:polyphosphate kinase
MLTANAEICADVEKVFMQLTSLVKVERLQHLWMAPFTLHRNLLAALGNRREDAARRQAGARDREDERADRRGDRSRRCMPPRRPA